MGTGWQGGTETWRRDTRRPWECRGLRSLRDEGCREVQKQALETWEEGRTRGWARRWGRDTRAETPADGARG